MSTAGGQDTEGTAPAVPSTLTTEQIATLPDRLLGEADWTPAGTAALLREAAQRICDLEEEVVAARADLHELKMGIALHRSSRDFMGGWENCDLRLWERIADVPWGKPIKGDG